MKEKIAGTREKGERSRRAKALVRLDIANNILNRTRASSWAIKDATH